MEGSGRPHMLEKVFRMSIGISLMHLFCDVFTREGKPKRKLLS